MQRSFALGLAALLLAVGSVGVPVQSGGPAPVETQQIVVVFNQNVPNAATVAREMSARHGFGLQHVYEHALRGFAAEVPAQAAAAIARDLRVATVEANVAHEIVAQALPTGVDRIETDKNPNVSTNGSGVTVNLDVAIIDTGIDGDHSDLNVGGGRNFAGGSTGKWGDGNGHGTHVAGTVGAIDNGSGVVGVAPGARVWAIKVCKNGGICMTGDMVAGIDWVAQQKASGTIDFAVANMSISTGDDANVCTGSSGAVHEAICGLVDVGVVFALAAGNNDRQKDAYPEVLAVSALADFDGKGGANGSPTCRSDEDDSLANFSNYGSEVDIAAPGVCILSTWNDGGTNTISGTSMAAPHVAGAVALYLHANGMSPATDSGGVNAIEQAILDAALPQGDACGYTNEHAGEGSVEPLLFVNGAAFGGDGSCDTAGGGGGSNNTAPVANDDSYSTDEDTTLSVAPDGVLSNDTDADGDSLSAVLVTGPSHGSLVLDADGSFTYDPAADYDGSDAFTYEANDASTNSNTATVSITVNAVNDAPVANDDTAATPVETPVDIDVLANDSDVDGDPLALTNLTQPANGAVTLNANSTVTYTPNLGFEGIDSFTYTANDGTVDSNGATVTVTVTDASTTHVGDLDASSYKLSQGYWGAIVTVAVHNAAGVLVENATVNGTFTQNGSSVGGFCTTDSSGTCTIDSGQLPLKSGNAAFTVDSVTHSSLTYDSTDNHDPDGDSDGTTISLSK